MTAMIEQTYHVNDPDSGGKIDLKLSAVPSGPNARETRYIIVVTQGGHSHTYTAEEAEAVIECLAKLKTAADSKNEDEENKATAKQALRHAQFSNDK